MKKVTLTIVVPDKEAFSYAQEMEDIPMASECIYTLACGDIQDLTSSEQEEVDEFIKIQ